jgi:hypothetical protein
MFSMGMSPQILQQLMAQQQGVSPMTPQQQPSSMAPMQNIITPQNPGAGGMPQGASPAMMMQMQQAQQQQQGGGMLQQLFNNPQAAAQLAAAIKARQQPQPAQTPAGPPQFGAPAAQPNMNNGSQAGGAISTLPGQATPTGMAAMWPWLQQHISGLGQGIGST